LTDITEVKVFGAGNRAEPTGWGCPGLAVDWSYRT